MATTLNTQPTETWPIDRVVEKIGAFAHDVGAEHELALCAASEAELPGRNLTEVRAMYVPARASDQEPGADRPRAK